MTIAGKKDRRIELRRRVLTRDLDSGQEVESWPEAYATVWAEKLDIKGREFFAALQVNAELTTVFRIRWRSDVLMRDRIIAEGLSYNVHSVAEIGRRRELEIMATAVRS